MAETPSDVRADGAFPVALKLVAIINDIPNRDRTETLKEAIYAVDSLGKEAGFGWVSTPEEQAIASAMKQLFCGPRTAHYGWRLYARYRQCGELTPLNITY